LLEKAGSIQPDVKIDAGDLDYDYDRKIGTFKKQVVLNRLKVNDPKQKTQKDPFRLTTDELAFETETNNFVARGNGILEHQDFTGAADRIEYDDASQILFFEGSASLKRPKGETIKGDLIRINLRDQTFTVRNNAVAELKVDSEK
jgi:lipopolysaccharide assembly outer membrane protein LptD (OstA)